LVHAPSEARGKLLVSRLAFEEVGSEVPVTAGVWVVTRTGSPAGSY
jgi:hypothetical protein